VREGSEKWGNGNRLTLLGAGGHRNANCSNIAAGSRKLGATTAGEHDGKRKAEVNQRIRFFRVALIIRLFVRPWAWLPLFQQHFTRGPYSSIDGLKFLFFNSRVYKVQTSPHCIREKNICTDDAYV
jgi:hypothetical protein